MKKGLICFLLIVCLAFTGCSNNQNDSTINENSSAQPSATEMVLYAETNVFLAPLIVDGEDTYDINRYTFILSDGTICYHNQYYVTEEGVTRLEDRIYPLNDVGTDAHLYKFVDARILKMFVDDEDTIYCLVRSEEGQYQLCKVKDGKMTVIAEDARDILHAEKKGIIYNTTTGIYQYNLETEENTLIYDLAAEGIQPAPEDFDMVPGFFLKDGYLTYINPLVPNEIKQWSWDSSWEAKFSINKDYAFLYNKYQDKYILFNMRDSNESDYIFDEREQIGFLNDDVNYRIDLLNTFYVDGDQIIYLVDDIYSSGNNISIEFYQSRLDGTDLSYISSGNHLISYNTSVVASRTIIYFCDGNRGTPDYGMWTYTYNMDSEVFTEDYMPDIERGLDGLYAEVAGDKVLLFVSWYEEALDKSAYRLENIFDE